MASPFTPSIQTPNGNFDPAVDRKLPPMGALTVGSMTSLTALGPTTGTNCDFVHGNEWEEVIGKRDVHLTLDLTTTIDVSEKRTTGVNTTTEIGGYFHFTTWGETVDKRGGIHQQYNFMPRFETYYHTLTQTHSETSKIKQPTTLLEKLNVVGKYVNASFSMTSIIDAGYKTTSVSLGGLDASTKIISIGNNVFAAKKDSFAVKDLDAGLHLRGAITEIKALKIKAALSHLKAIGANLCAGIAANLDSPFA